MRRHINAIVLLLSLFSSCVIWAVQDSRIIYTEDKLSVVVTKNNPEFTIKLKSNPSTGYSWFLRDYNMDLIQPIKHSVEKSTDKKLMGASGYEVWTFQTKPAAFVVPHQTLIRFYYSRPWETIGPGSQIAFTVSTG